MDDGIAARMAQVAVEMGEQPTLRATFDSICHHAVVSLRADGCRLFLQRGRRTRVAASSGPRVGEAEPAQVEADEGPCLEGVWSSESVLVDDLRSDGRWPRWARSMVDLGWGSALSLRLSEDDRTVGSLNLLRHDPHGFTVEDVEVALIFARHASLALASSRTEASLADAVGARHRVGLAQGMLMERYGLDVAGAFEALRRHSQDLNLKLHAVATHVVEHRELPDGRLDA